MQLALQKLLRTRSSLSLLSSLLAAPVGVDQFPSKGKCIRCAVHRTKSRQDRSDAADLPREDSIGARRGPQRSYHAKPQKLHGSRPTTATHKRRSGHISDSQRYFSARAVPATADYSTVRGRKTAPESLALLNHPDESDTPISKNWLSDPQRMKFESDVGHSRDIGSKLVDNPRFADDFELWKNLLLYRKRHDAIDGVMDIWRGLRERGKPVDLPVVGPHALFFWGNLLSVGRKRGQFLEEIHAYASQLKQSGTMWDEEEYYKSIVVELFKEGRYSQAVQWHERLKDTHITHQNELLLQLFEHATKARSGLRAFRKICRTFEDHQIYSIVVPSLSRARMLADAFAMHNFLVQRNDLPQTFKDVEPLVRHLKRFGSQKEKETFSNVMNHHGLFQNEALMVSLPFGRKDATDRDADDTTKVRGEEGEGVIVNEALGARLFATNSFKFGLILEGIRAFGATGIGPQTLRQMALKAGNADVLLDQIESLKREGISIGNSAFSKVVYRLALEGNESVLDELIRSDLHPDVLENVETLEELLTSSSMADDHPRASMLLKVLSLLPTEDPYNYNIMLRNAIHMGDSEGLPRILDEMCEHDVKVSKRSFCLMTERILPPRRAGLQKSRDMQHLDSVLYLIELFQNMVRKGFEIPPIYWKEALKQLGMAADWHDFRKICHWLVHAYSPIDSKLSNPRSLDPILPEDPIHQIDDKLLLPAAHPMSPLRQLFSPQFQKAIIAWGFNLEPNAKERHYNPFSETGEEELIPWLRGHVLLRELKERGVIVQLNTVRKITRQRFAVLFGEYRESSRPKNRMLRYTNPWTLQEILRDIDKVWGFSLFGEMAEQDLEALVNPLPNAQGVKRYNERILAEYRFRSGEAQDEDGEGSHWRYFVRRPRKKYVEEKIKIEKRWRVDDQGIVRHVSPANEST
ncbi:hypothetical protein AJ79_07621 [Helicocarpus griseus UAMH5409]|uniref:Pentatricopeptide repeat domain-containing protein n=1 Tax=Helicocarpus griseus UAMH5409 TaxID=1447875 RepID=A0A2B7X1D6_9EURO|nr:hypothetical protein AJ79_07621 [Helicocarpus griseus UAMH5409]